MVLRQLRIDPTNRPDAAVFAIVIDRDTAFASVLNRNAIHRDDTA